MHHIRRASGVKRMFVKQRRWNSSLSMSIGGDGREEMYRPSYSCLCSITFDAIRDREKNSVLHDQFIDKEVIYLLLLAFLTLSILLPSRLSILLQKSCAMVCTNQVVMC